MAAKVSALAVQLEAVGTEKVKSAILDIERTAAKARNGMKQAFDPAGPNRFAASTRTMAMGLEQVARTGNLAGEGVKGIITSGAEMALMFGAGGAIAGAIGITALGIVNMFRRTRDEMRKTTEAWIAERARMVNAGDVSSQMEQLRTLELGTPAKFGADGLRAMEARAANIRQNIETMRAETGRVSARTGTKIESEELRALVKDLRTLETEIGKAKQKIKDLRSDILNPANAPLPPIAGLPSVNITAPGNARNARAADSAIDNAIAAANRRTAAGLRQAQASLDFISENLAQQVDRALKPVRERIAALVDPDVMFPQGTITYRVPKIRELDPLPPDALKGMRAQLDDQFGSLSTAIAASLGTALATGFAAAFAEGNVGAGLDALKSSVLSGLGSIMMEMGQSLLFFGVSMLKLLPALANPFTSGPAAIAAGAALLALGGMLGGLAQGRKGAAGSGGGNQFGGYGRMGDLVQIKIVGTQPSKASELTAVGPAIGTVILIGENDPAAAAALRRMVNKDKWRGGS